MEMEFFCPPDEALKWYEFWKHQRMQWWLSLGIAPSNLRFRDHEPNELSHYSKATVDIEYKYPFTAPDFGELEGIAHRGDFDLTQHQKYSGAKLEYFDQDLQLRLKEQGASQDEIRQKSRYVPNVIEPASGLTRAVLVLLCEAYRYDESRPSKEYFAFKPRFAPVKVGIFPLVNKDGMPEIAEKLYLNLRKRLTCEYDPKQSIGKRYARMDEIGTPFCVTIDGETTSHQTVTVRHRDTQAQDKVHLSQVEAYLLERLNDESTSSSI
jgi:glycyl-tRNA synthetase